MYIALPNPLPSLIHSVANPKAIRPSTATSHCLENQ
jgi:hypothetical protein